MQDINLPEKNESTDPIYFRSFFQPTKSGDVLVTSIRGKTIPISWLEYRYISKTIPVYKLIRHRIRVNCTCHYVCL